MPVTSKELSGSDVRDMQLLVFRAANEEYAFALTEVREIIRTPAITAVPSVEAYVQGVTNLRGKIVTVIDLPHLLGLQDGKNTQHVIVVEKGAELFGFRVDEVTEVLRVPMTQVKAVPQVLAAKVPASYLENAVVLEDEKAATAHPSRIILILKLQDILTSLTPASL